MPTCRSSRSSARVSLALGALLLASAAALAQDSPSSSSARDKAAAQGDAALDRLERPTATRKREAEAHGPTSLPTPSEETRRRPFDGLLYRTPPPPMDTTAPR